MLHSLQLLQPTTIAQASQALLDFGDKAKVYNGGAELLLLLRQGLLQGEILIDVKKIERLHKINLQTNELRIGACVTHQALANSELVREQAPSLAYAESQVANVRVRNQGTLGGNLCFNDPHSDPGTVLLVHDATVTLGSQKGERQLSLSDFFVDMYATALEPDELLLEVHVPSLPVGMRSCYLRLHRQQRPTLGVAVAVKLVNGLFEEARIAVGCIGPRAQRTPEIEEKVRGAKLSELEKILTEQKTYLRELLRPVDDLLGSAEYKLYMAGIFVRDALAQAAPGNGGGQF
jgi:aerobic carbon-monoxide dehydrogenase medium subunit